MLLPTKSLASGTILFWDFLFVYRWKTAHIIPMLILSSSDSRGGEAGERSKVSEKVRRPEIRELSVTLTEDKEDVSLLWFWDEFIISLLKPALKNLSHFMEVPHIKLQAVAIVAAAEELAELTRVFDVDERDLQKEKNEFTTVSYFCCCIWLYIDAAMRLCSTYKELWDAHVSCNVEEAFQVSDDSRKKFRGRIQPN